MRTAAKVLRIASALMLVIAATASGQDFGHRIPGALGVNAGRQPEPGLSVAVQPFLYSADALVDRDGHPIPVQGFRLRAVANGFGAAYTLRCGPLFLNFSASAPVARARLTSDLPQASIDKFGLGDARLQPIGAGLRGRRFELVAAYAFYIPTGRYEPGGVGPLGRGSFSEELAAGGTAFFDAERRWHLGALASYELNHKKLGIDVTRGDTFQIQGGAGWQAAPAVDLGVAAYALWQVRDDRGSDLPEVLVGSRDRTFGVGPEVGLRIPAWRTRLALRYEQDFGTRARPQGQVLTLQVVVQLWRPTAATAGEGAPASRG